MPVPVEHGDPVELQRPPFHRGFEKLLHPKLPVVRSVNPVPRGKKIDETIHLPLIESECLPRTHVRFDQITGRQRLNSPLQGKKSPKCLPSASPRPAGDRPERRRKAEARKSAAESPCPRPDTYRNGKRPDSRHPSTRGGRSSPYVRSSRLYGSYKAVSRPAERSPGNNRAFHNAPWRPPRPPCKHRVRMDRQYFPRPVIIAREYPVFSEMRIEERHGLPGPLPFRTNPHNGSPLRLSKT